MILTLDVVSLVARLILVLIPLLLLLPVCIAILKLDYGTTLTMVPALVSLDIILIPPRHSSAMPALPFTAPSAILPTLPNATPALLVQSSTTSPRPAPARLVTSSMELPVSSVLTTVRPAAHRMVLALAVLTLRGGISLKIASASVASMTLALLTALPALLLASPAPTEPDVPLAMPLSSET